MAYLEIFIFRVKQYAYIILEKIFYACGFILFAIGFFGGGILLLYQIGSYLKNGIWNSYSLLHIIKLFGESYRQWVNFPSNWQGIHSILGVMPLTLFLILVIGYLLPLLFVRLEEKYRNKIIV